MPETTEEPQDSSFEELLERFEKAAQDKDACQPWTKHCVHSAEYTAARAALSRYVEQLKAENAQLRERVLSDSEMRELRNATMLHSSGISEELRRKLRRSIQGDTAQ